MGYVDVADPDLVALGGDVTQAVEAGAFEIDQAFACAGVAVPVDTTVLDATPKLRLDKWLELVNKAIAAWHLTGGSVRDRGTPKAIEKNVEEARKQLAKIAAGKIPFLGLTLTGSQGFRAVGDVVWPDTNVLYDIEDVVGGWC